MAVGVDEEIYIDEKVLQWLKTAARLNLAKLNKRKRNVALKQPNSKDIYSFLLLCLVNVLCQFVRRSLVRGLNTTAEVLL